MTENSDNIGIFEVYLIVQAETGGMQKSKNVKDRRTFAYLLQQGVDMVGSSFVRFTTNLFLQTQTFLQQVLICLIDGSGSLVTNCFTVVISICYFIKRISY